MKKGPKKKPARSRTAKRRPKKSPRRPAVKRPKARKHHKPAAKPRKKPKPKTRITVILYPVIGPKGKPVLRRSKGDKVRWRNKDAADHTLQFGIWIFKEPAGPILVLAGKHTGWYTIDPAVALGTYSYAIIPAFAAQGPPDPPQVEADS